MTNDREPNDPAFDGQNLASLRLGATVVLASDDFFAEKENLLLAHEAEWKEHAYTDKGKWMDGWESRRKRHPDGTADTSLHPDFHDWAIVRLGSPGRVRALIVDTAWFRGNFPEACEVWGTAAPIDASEDTLLSPRTAWTKILGKSALAGNAKNRFVVDSPWAFTHVKLVIFPDGGVARLRVIGDVVREWHRHGHALGEVDLAAAESGGDVIAASDMFFGERRNLIMPGRAVNMSDGWETRRRRGPGNDWSIVKLVAPASISRVEIDTNHFKGNFPDTCSIDAAFVAEGASIDGAAWRPLLARTKLSAHTRHFFEPELEDAGRVSHVRLSVYPDGGVSRLRVWGTLDEAARRTLGLERINRLPPPEASAAFVSCAASARWAEGMTNARPFPSEEAMLEVARARWAELGEADLLEVMSAHPRIGERDAAKPREAQEKAWSKREQSGMALATDAERARMAELNAAYEAKFGFTYIVCASGKSATELVTIVEERLANGRAEELQRAGRELFEIAALRLRKMALP